MPPLVVLHDIFAVKHLIADFTGVQLLSVFLFVLGQITVSGEKPGANLALERFVICKNKIRERFMLCMLSNIYCINLDICKVFKTCI